MDGCYLRSAFARLLFLPCLLYSSTSFSLPVIQELYYDQPGSDGSEVFTELFATPGMNLKGWKLVGINGSNGLPYRTLLLNQLLVPDDGIVVISTNAASQTLELESDYLANIDWQNGVDAVQLWSPNDQLIDAIQYGDLAGFNAGEGRPAPDASAGKSLSRKFSGYDTEDNFSDFLILSSPTPGKALIAAYSLNAAAITVDESGSMPLLLLGLGLLMFRKH